MCVRGLKLVEFLELCQVKFVARRVRAWIETFRRNVVKFFLPVARRVRAWIETSKFALFTFSKFVARRVRAWIETSSYITAYHVI